MIADPLTELAERFEIQATVPVMGDTPTEAQIRRTTWIAAANTASSARRTDEAMEQKLSALLGALLDIAEGQQEALSRLHDAVRILSP